MTKNNLNFVIGGLMGDFIQSLFAVKNICEQNDCKANVYISENHGGDIFTFGVEKAYHDVKDLVMHQSYIDSFVMLDKRGKVPEGCINLNNWREEAATEFHETGEYGTCWSERLSKKFNFTIPDQENYKWLVATSPDNRTKDKIVIHRSQHRWGGLPWEKIIDTFHEDRIVFVTTNRREYDLFRQKYTKYMHLILVKTITEMANAISSCKLFVGNQSAPFSIASALDVPRLGELESGVWKFYKDENLYSKNISWHVSDENKFFTSNSIITL